MTDDTALKLATDLFDSAVKAHDDSKKDVTAKAVTLLAVATRGAFPGAVSLHFEDSDQGDYLTIHYVQLSDETADWEEPEFEALTDAYDHVSSYLYPEDVEGFTWERGKRGTIDAHINIEEALSE